MSNSHLSWPAGCQWFEHCLLGALSICLPCQLVFLIHHSVASLSPHADLFSISKCWTVSKYDRYLETASAKKHCLLTWKPQVN
jgi:hypothetical protein